jgi:BioD-like phosphotransacetylase family protein
VIRRSALASRRGQILVLLLYTLLGGSGLIGVGIFATGRSIDALEDRIEDVVTDKSRRKSAQQVLATWEKQGEAFLDEHAERREQLLEKLERHATRPAELRALFGAMSAANQQIQTRVLDQRFALKALLTRAEWEQLFPR